ncbi:MAG TPA: hypothetical protein VN239_06875 [Nitrososphaera sp.]|jgi:hypothetical protein|nr:hypothetical protein [Nitrososphaera sp.]
MKEITIANDASSCALLLYQIIIMMMKIFAATPTAIASRRSE